MTPKRGNAGNVLVFILVAIFLIGALTALLMRSSATTEETGSTERLTIQASQLMRFTVSVQNAVERMRLNGVSEDEISFANTFYKTCANANIQGPGHNPKCTSQACEIFGSGGGATPFSVPDSLKAGAGCSLWPDGAMAISTREIINVGSEANDLVLEVYGLSRGACATINKLVHIPNWGDDAPEDEENSSYLFSGDYAPATGVIGDDEPDFEGKKALCLKRPSDETYHFYTVLIAR